MRDSKQGGRGHKPKLVQRPQQYTLDHTNPTWTQLCISPHLSHCIRLALTDANIHCATKMGNVPATKMEAAVVGEVLES